MTTPLSAGPLPEPDDEYGDSRDRFLDYLDYFRSAVVVKLSGLTEEQARHSRLPSGWSPIELAQHLAFMERRWLRWGFLGEETEDPWGDHDKSGRWSVEPGRTLADVVALLLAGGPSTRSAVEGAELADRAAVGGRFAAGSEPPTLEWILFHVLQEYARHAGHLDIVRELIDGSVGE